MGTVNLPSNPPSMWAACRAKRPRACIRVLGADIKALDQALSCLLTIIAPLALTVCRDQKSSGEGIAAQQQQAGFTKPMSRGAHVQQSTGLVTGWDAGLEEALKALEPYGQKTRKPGDTKVGKGHLLACMPLSTYQHVVQGLNYHATTAATACCARTEARHGPLQKPPGCSGHWVHQPSQARGC